MNLVVVINILSQIQVYYLIIMEVHLLIPYYL